MHSKFNQAINFFEKGNLNESKKLCLEILKDEPKNFDILHLLGIVSFKLKNYKNSVDLIAKAITVNPKSAEAYNNQSLVLKKINKLEDAIESLNQAIKIKPDFIHAYNSRGHLLVELNRLDAALENFNKSIEINPNFAEAYNNRGNILNKLNRFTESLESYDKAISINPNFAEAYNNRATVQKDLKLYDGAHESYEKAIKIKPNLDFLLGSLIYSKLYLCNWKAFDEILKKIEESIDKGNKSLTSFTSLLCLNSPSLQKKVAEIYFNWLKKFVKNEYNGKNILNHKFDNQAKKKIRIAYYSADFRNHPMSYLLANLYELHDKNKFEVIGISFGPDKDDEMRKRVSSAFDEFYDVRLKTEEEIVKFSRELKIDIAIDLMCFTKYHRFGIFVQRCAPIQVNYLGYPGTSGTNYLDYIIADKVLIPKDNQKYYSEKIVYLPDTYQANDSTKKISDKIFTREELGLPKDGFVFCCFNNNYKITPQVFDIWMRLLKRVKNSVLWILSEDVNISKNLKKEATLRGVDFNRIVFAEKIKMNEHLARQKVADLFIDTFPYTAHTTASDALWVGLPVLTRIGKSFASRVSASLLNAIDLPELVTSSEKEYEDLAAELATNSEKLKEIKNKLKNNRNTKPLFNTQIFTRNIEKAYSLMYERYLKNLPLDNIEIS